MGRRALRHDDADASRLVKANSLSSSSTIWYRRLSSLPLKVQECAGARVWRRLSQEAGEDRPIGTIPALWTWRVCIIDAAPTHLSCHFIVFFISCRYSLINTFFCIRVCCIRSHLAGKPHFTSTSLHTAPRIHSELSASSCDGPRHRLVHQSLSFPRSLPSHLSRLPLSLPLLSPPFAAST